MSDLNEEAKKIEKEEGVKFEMLEKEKQSLKVPKKEGSEALHTQMTKKVRPTDCRIIKILISI